MKIAVFADLHYPAAPDPVKQAVLEWTVATARREQADCIVGAGDMISFGTAEEARKMRAALDGSGIPWLYTMGNAELRTPAETGAVRAILGSAEENSDVILLDSSVNALQESDRARLEALAAGQGKLLVTHIPPASWPEADRAALRRARERGAVAAVMAGHVHCDGPETLRGLDPDKAAGGPPMLLFGERTATGKWRFRERVMPGIDPADWSCAERRKFRADLGLALMYEPVAMLEFAIANRIAAVELRGGSVPDTDAHLDELLKRWREEAGGKILSLHLSELAPAAAGKETELARTVRRAVELGCQRVTLHVPLVGKDAYPAERDALLAQARRVLAPLVAAGIAVGIENMHWKAGDTEATRRFGCTIEECREWIRLLRETLPGASVGFHLDIGHARNNGVWASRQPLGLWYAGLGAELNGMHIHQVEQKTDGTFANHRKLTGFYDKLIVLSGLFFARNHGVMKSVPMFLEVRENGGPASYTALTGKLDSCGAEDADV